MADQLDNIIKVVITRQTRAPSMKSFSEHLIVSDFSPVGVTPIFDPAHRVRIFGGLDEITAAGFPVDGYVYRAAAKQYSQSPHIGNIYVGWKIPGGVWDIQATINQAFVTGNIVSWTVGGVAMPDVSFDEEGSNEKIVRKIVSLFNEIFESETTAIEVDSSHIRFYGAKQVIEISVDGGVSQPALTFSGDANPLVADASWAVALSAIKAQNNDWYAVSTSARSMIHQQECAQWVQANEKLGILTSGDDAIVDAETGDIATWAKLNNLDRVIVFYHPDAKLADAAVDALAPLDPIPEAAYFSKMLAKHPGSATWKFKELQSIPTYELTQGQASTVEGKNATWYMTTADVPMTAEGKTAAGEYIDVIQGLDWLKARIQNLVFTPLVQQDKIPYTDEGVQILVSSLRAALDEGVRYQILASYDISYPAVADLAANWKAARVLPDINFTGVLGGAIHKTIINGVITL
jgi:hypothetical protein